MLKIAQRLFFLYYYNLQSQISLSTLHGIFFFIGYVSEARGLGYKYEKTNPNTKPHILNVPPIPNEATTGNNQLYH